MCVGVPHLDSLQEAGVPKQEFLVSQRIKGEVNRRWPLEQARTLLSCQATPQGRSCPPSYLSVEQPKFLAPWGLKSLAGLIFIFSLFFKTGSYIAWDGLLQSCDPYGSRPSAETTGVPSHPPLCFRFSSNTPSPVSPISCPDNIQLPSMPAIASQMPRLYLS